MNAGVVGVIGAGTIGRGVAQSLAQSGHRVILVDRSDGQLALARSVKRARREADDIVRRTMGRR